MPKVWIAFDFGHCDYYMLDREPEGDTNIDFACVEMNASLHRQIRSAEKKFAKFQDVLEKFHTEGLNRPNRVPRVR